MAQSASLKKANDYYEKRAYAKAAEWYQKALSRSDNLDDATIKIAHCYRFLNNDVAAEHWYGKAVQLSNIEPISWYYYGMALKGNGKYADAKVAFYKYIELNPEDTRAKHKIEACDQITFLKTDAGVYAVEITNLNTQGAEFSPAFYNEGIVFASNQNLKYNKRDAERDEALFELFYAQLSGESPARFATPSNFKSKNDQDFHHSTVTFTDEGRTMYFTGNNPNAGDTQAGKAHNLQIFKSYFKNNAWTSPYSFPYNGNGYSMGHPSITKDAQTIYFTSNIAGGYGGTDIYACQKEGNKWGKPTNLGETINTAGDEMFPFIAEDGTLYFASDGLPGIGNLDLFSSRPISASSWEKPNNLRAPINSPQDDFGFIINADNSYGYFSSNRLAGKGADDIYSFTMQQQSCQIKGRVFDKSTGEGIKGAVLRLMTGAGQEAVFRTASDGRYIFEVMPDRDYNINATKEFYFTQTLPISTKGRDCSAPLEQDIALDIELSKIPDIDTETGKLNTPIRIVSGGENSHPDLPLPDINHIYYDLDKHNIRPDAALELDKIVAFMQQNPELILELGAHTDTRGTGLYNQTLSERRAKSATDYIVGKGVSIANITAIGYGEMYPINGCIDGVDCVEDQHQENRRTEFVITGYLLKR
ncbi:MAG: OmpA family protein [Chitinophagales bacterium]